MYNKGTNYEILKTVFKVPQTLLIPLKSHNVNFKAGDKSIRLEYKDLVKTLEFNTLLGSIIKNPTPESIVKVNGFVSNFLNDIATLNPTLDVTPVDVTPVGVNVTKQANPSKVVKSKPFSYPEWDSDDITGGLSSVEKKLVKSAVKSEYIKAIAELNGLAPVTLKNAKYLYQKVQGTSAGSIYRVIAIASSFLMAARIHENTVSIRLEPTEVLDKKIESKFKSLGLQSKGNYMSGHFTCTKCTPKRLIGAILVDSELEFLTPIPTVTDTLFS